MGTETKYYVIDIQWSQTDKDTVVVRASSEDAALNSIKSKCNAPYISVVRVADSLKIV